MRIRTFLALLALSSFVVACGDEDPATVPNGDTGTADADTGADTGADTPTEDVGGTCENTCLRLSDCAGAGLTTPSCVEGCCVEGTPVDPPDPVEECGDVTFQGECDGATVIWCQDGELQTVDCAGFYEGATGTCEFFNDDFGYFCAAPEGYSCFSGDGTALCGGEGESGCLVSDLTSADGSTCTGFDSACTAPGEADPAFEGYCEGDVAVFSCNVNQPTAFDCASMGGSCDAGICINLQPGDTCFAGFLECAAGLECAGDADAPGVCEGEVAEPTCEDGIENGDEEGVDCGGSCDGACAAEPTCDDGEMNGDEEGVDCGGSCDACEVAATCDDEEQNGNESAVDCGGDECDACADGDTCGVAGDCVSGVCGVDDSLCAAAACDDGVQNGDEIGVDCGGSCDPC